MDTGTHESYAQATGFIQTVEERQGLKIACLEEIAHLMGCISGEKLKEIPSSMLGSSYGDYLNVVLKEQEG